MTTKTNTSDNLHQTLDNPLFQAVEQVGNLLSISKKTSNKKTQVTKELHEYEATIIKKRGSTPHR